MSNAASTVVVGLFALIGTGAVLYVLARAKW